MDGNVTLTLDYDPRTINPGWARLLARAHARRAERDEFDGDDSLVAKLGDVECEVRAPRDNLVIVHVADQFRLTLTLDRHQARVVFFAPLLWSAHDAADSIEHWVQVLTSRLTPHTCASLREAAACGWRTSRLDLAADFVDLEVASIDRGLFTSVAESSDYAHGSHPHSLIIGQSGRRLCISNKTRQVKRKLRTEPVDSIYAPTWSAHGWDGDATITRIEWQLRSKRYLQFKDRQSGEVYDFTDPARLQDREALAILWHHLCTTWRLTVGGTTRKRRAKTDPNWQRVIEAAGNSPVIPLRQSRDVRRLTRQQYLRGGRQRHRRSLLEITHLAGGDVRDAETRAEVAAELARQAIPTGDEIERLRARFGFAMGEGFATGGDKP